MSDSEEQEQEVFSVVYTGEESRPYLWKDGAATSTFPNTDVYSGAYVDRLKQGPSTYAFTSISPTTSYQGAYQAGQREGEGAMTYPDGSSYKGGWKAGQRDGWGRYTYPNGDVWVGPWKAGKKEGEGTYIYKRDGSHFDGVWSANACDTGRWSYYHQRQHTATVQHNTVTQYM